MFLLPTLLVLMEERSSSFCGRVGVVCPPPPLSEVVVLELLAELLRLL